MPGDPHVTKDYFRAELQRLVANFAANEAELTAPGYTEMQCRTQFITPFFRALGWDVENRAGKPYRDMEVLEEKGPGKTRKDPGYVILCNEGDRFVEEWLCPRGCTRRECERLASNYAVDVCHPRGEGFYALSAPVFGIPAAETTFYSHCCQKKKKKSTPVFLWRRI